MNRGTAECNAHKTMGPDEPYILGNRGQEDMLNQHAIHEPTNGCTFKTELTIILDICFCACGGGGYKVAVYFRRQSAVKPDGWVYIIGGLHP